MRGRSSQSTSHTVPAIVFHGDGDTTVHPSNGEQRFTAHTVETGEERGRKYTRTVSSGKPALEQWLRRSPGHAWPGGSPKGPCTDPRATDATRAVLMLLLPAAPS